MDTQTDTPREVPSYPGLPVVKALVKKMGRLRLRDAVARVCVSDFGIVRCDNKPQLTLSFVNSRGKRVDWSVSLDRTPATEVYDQLRQLEGQLIFLLASGRLYTVLTYSAMNRGESVRRRVTGTSRTRFRGQFVIDVEAFPE